MARKPPQSRDSRTLREHPPVHPRRPSAEQAAGLEIYDTTLRDGAQAEDVSFSADDKVLIAQKLDELGVHFIEGGWPGANPKDIEFFRMIKTIPLKHANVIAFGSTRKASNAVRKDPNLQALLAAETTTITLFGKTWSLHVTDALGISLAKNLELIGDSIAYLRGKGRRVFYDAEHFFDGYKTNPDYALATIRKAVEAGAERVILCDTNGGTMPWEIRDICSVVQRECAVPLGIHAHNDCEMAVANSLVAIETGILQVQGTINGIGERCGNANLCSIIPNLELKMKRRALSDRLNHLKDVAGYVTEIANLMPNKHQPYVGDSAFAHKGGVHIHAVLKNPATYEHIDPARVGNRQRMLISDYGGRSGLLDKVEAYGIKLTKDHAKVNELIHALKDRESQGYQFEGAEGSFELLMRKVMGSHKPSFQLLGFRVIVEKKQEDGPPLSEATVMVKVGEVIEHTAAVGAGPVNALDHALRKALEKFYPQLQEVKLLDYKVRVLAANKGTESKVRVLIESGDHKDKWGTVGVSENIMEATWQALADSIEYKLLATD
ncbi:MAG: citramalate synthase [Nitrospira sp.]|jgi:2-isopropylmalate synthase|nr:citramalate synthase [Nitrospira sp.]MDH4243023.1 citramalate synthase [Nitrospira sp.]MDH4356520.1 citramalate synthase [Nitrospira sp.]MDH5317320.1 citramalate synthase [Nitrospira sp.]